MIKKERVQSRLDALRKSPITAAKEVGLERTYIYQIINSNSNVKRPRDVSVARLGLIAKALDCDPRYLTGEIDDPRLENQENTALASDVRRSLAAQLPVAGVCETGVWRKIAAIPSVQHRMSIVPDQRYPADPQSLYEVRGPGMEGEGIYEGMIAVGLDYEHFVHNVRRIETGMIVVLRRERDVLQEVELSLRKVEVRGRSTILKACPKTPMGFEDVEFEHPPEGEQLRVAAVISVVVKRFL